MTAALLSSLEPEKLPQRKVSYEGMWAGWWDWAQGSAGVGDLGSPRPLCPLQTGRPSQHPRQEAASTTSRSVRPAEAF